MIIKKSTIVYKGLIFTILKSHIEFKLDDLIDKFGENIILLNSLIENSLHYSLISDKYDMNTINLDGLIWEDFDIDISNF